MRRATGFLVFVLLTSSAAGQFDRPWQVYLVPFSHTDVGFTAPVPDVLADHHRYLDTVVAWCSREDTVGNEARFRWTIEIPWVLETYLAARTAAQAESLMALVREGRIEIGAMHFGLQTDLCAPEELVRSLAYAGELHRRYGVPVRMAMINDTPGFTWALAEILPAAGVPYLAVAMNSFLSSFYTTTTLPYLFRVRAQSGSEVLVWRCIETNWAYLEGALTVGVYNSYPVMEFKLTEFLQKLALAGYPYDEVMINCATGDNGAPDYSIVANVRQWNDAHAGTRLRISTASEFFDTVAARYGNAIPLVSGDASNWWSWIFAPSSTGGMILSRQAQDLIPSAEALATIASAVLPAHTYPGSRLRHLYVQNLLFEDHNLGALTASGSEEFWPRKIGWIDSALTGGREILDDAADALAGSIPTGEDHSVAVFNTLGWWRPSTVTLPPVVGIPGLGSVFDVVDAVRGTPVPKQALHDGRVVFAADSLPPFGYRVYRLVPTGGSPPAPVSLAGNTLEGNRFRVRVNTGTGGLTELLDKSRSVDLTAGDGLFGVYRYNGSQLPSGLTVAQSDSGPVLQQFVLSGSAPGSASYEITVALHPGAGRVEVRHRYDKLPPGASETVDFWFNSGLDAPSLRYEIPYGAVRLFDDELSGFRVNHYSAGRWLTVTSASEGAMVLSTAHVPVVAPPGGVFNGGIRMLASFNSASTGYRAGVGPLKADFAVTAFPFDPGPAEAHRVAYGYTVPPVVRLLPPFQSGSLPAGQFSFAESGQGPSVVTALKRADAGGGIILRLFNPSDSPATAMVRSRDMALGPAMETTLLEEDQSPIPPDGGGFLLSMAPFDVRTVRIAPVVSGAAGEDVPLTREVGLERNFPNPFNPSTTIRFSLPERAEVRLTVTDILGRTVRTLAAENLPAGLHERRWDGRDERGIPCGSGVYFCTLSAGAGSSRSLRTIRMGLVR